MIAKDRSLRDSIGATLRDRVGMLFSNRAGASGDGSILPGLGARCTIACGMNGYRSPLYAESLAEFGTPIYLPRSDGWLLGLPIPESAKHDAIGCYPLFDCGNWQMLGAGSKGFGVQSNCSLRRCRSVCPGR